MMKRNFTFIMLFILILLSSYAHYGMDTDAGTEDVNGDKTDYFALTDQKNGCITVYNLAEDEINSPGAVVWKYSLPSTEYYAIADARLRNCELYGDVVIAACSNYACMVSYPMGKLLWSTTDIAVNGHAVELLPNGNIAVASSSGGEIRLFASSQGKTVSNYYSVKLKDAHGVLWDPGLEVLWALGGNVLTAYHVGGTDTEPTLTEVAEMRVTLPSGSAHDLWPVYGDTNRLWVTNSASVFQYDKTTKMFMTDYDGFSVINTKNTKSIGNLPVSGTIIRTIPNNTYQSWNTDTIDIITINGGIATVESLKITAGAYYKVRVFCADYQ